MIWYEYQPADTLFFRGSEPMEAGIDYKTETLFPPPVSVLKGAVRTAVLAKENISIAEYKDDKNGISEKIGKFGQENTPFEAAGFILKRGVKVFIPAPFNLYAEKTEYEENDEFGVVYSELIENSAAQKLGLRTGHDKIHWAVTEKEAASLGGTWINKDSLNKNSLVKGKDIIGCLPTKGKNNGFPVYFTEERTGIKLDKSKTVEEGMLYSGKHIRLNTGIKLVFGLTKDIGLGKSGIMTPGGEKRFGKYEKSDISIELPDGDRFLSMNPVEADDEKNEKVIASGKIKYRGGWDLNTGFHKPMKAFYPAGSVFNENINNCCLAF